MNKKLIVTCVGMIVSFLVVLAFVIASFINNSDKVPDNQFVVMSTTDVHGKFWDYSLESGQQIPDNMLCASTGVNEIRKDFNDKAVLFDNGDFYQGSVLSTLNLKDKHSDMNSCYSPAAICMRHMKYDGFTFGNHEFNYNYDNMKTQFNYVRKTSQLVCANVYYPGSNEHVFQPYMTKSIKVGGKDIKIGIIGIGNTDIKKWDNAEHFQNWRFFSKENPSGDITYEIKKAKDEMIANGDICDLTIVSYHSGFFGEGSSEHTNPNYEQKLESQLNDNIEFLKNSETQGYRAVRKSSGIDMFILGHDHCNIYSNNLYKNADGKDVLVVNGAKNDITKSVFEVVYDSDDNPKINLINSSNIKFGNFDEDISLKQKIQPYVNDTDNFLSKYVGKLVGNWDLWNKDYGNSYIEQTGISDLNVRSEFWYAKKFLKHKFSNNAEINRYIKTRLNNESLARLDESAGIDLDMAFATGSYGALPKSCDITYRDTCSIYTFEDSIEVVAATGQNIKNALEYNATNRYKLIEDESGKHIEPINDKYTMLVTYGLNFYYDMNRPEGDRVVIEGFANGKQFDPNRIYCLSLNSYLWANPANPELAKLSENNEFMDASLEGPKELDKFILSDYIQEMTDLYGGVYPTDEADKNGEVISHWKIKY